MKGIAPPPGHVPPINDTRCSVKPYYEHAGIVIYHGDGRALLPELAADVLSLDPPYGTNEHGGYGRRQLGLETIENDADTVVRDDLLSIWGPRTALVFGSPRRPEPPGDWSWRLCWNKLSPGLGAPWRWQHEMIYLRGDWSNKPGLPSVLSYSAGSSMRDRLHPHQKPTDLMRALLMGTSGRIVDPTMGSGSTLEAAKSLGRQAIGIELDERLCEVAAKRLGQEVMFA